jgi:hypothetical protein
VEALRPQGGQALVLWLGMQVSAEAAAAAQKEHEASHSMLSTLSHTNSSPEHGLAKAPPTALSPARRIPSGRVRPSLDSDLEWPIDTATPTQPSLDSSHSSIKYNTCCSGTERMRAGTSAAPGSARSAPAIGLKIGVLHFTPMLEPFPLLAYPQTYKADTYNLSDPDEREFWLSLLAANVPAVVEKACLCGESCIRGGKSLTRRLKALEVALNMHLESARLRPELCEPLSLCELFDMREACLREFKFHDIYQCVLWLHLVSCVVHWWSLKWPASHLQPIARTPGLAFP